MPDYIGVVSLRSTFQRIGWHRIHVEESFEGCDETLLIFPSSAWASYKNSGITSVREWCRVFGFRWWGFSPSIISESGELVVDLENLVTQEYGCC